METASQSLQLAQRPQTPNQEERSDQNPPHILLATLEESLSVDRTDPLVKSELTTPTTAPKNVFTATSSRSSTGIALAAHNGRKRHLQTVNVLATSGCQC